MRTFLTDTIELNKRMARKTLMQGLELEANVQVVFYYIDPKNNNIKLIMKRCLMSGIHSLRNEVYLGLMALTGKLDDGDSIETILTKFKINSKVVAVNPLGIVMGEPETRAVFTELLLIHIEPPVFADEGANILYSDNGTDIGVISMNDVMPAMNNYILLDTNTRLMLTELYIILQQMPPEELTKLTQPTNNITDEDNSHLQKDFGAMFKN